MRAVRSGRAGEGLLVSLRRRLLLSFLRRRDDEIAVRARTFRIVEERDRKRVVELGRAFLSGYHTMLEASTIGEVRDQAARVEAHWRPFFFEGAAMGYLPRGYLHPNCTLARAERDLLDLDPALRYLYYVGLGFWYGFRHRRRPARLCDLTDRVEKLYAPLCWDGFGFKIGFFDFDLQRGARSLATLLRCPSAEQAWVHQGLGRAMFFVFRDDPAGFDDLAASLSTERRLDLEFGRALAQGFTGLDRPDSLAEHVAQAPDAARRLRRLLGVTWALTARRMSDPDHFAACLARASPTTRRTLSHLPDLCEAARDRATSYGDWQQRTARRIEAAS